MLTFLRKYLIPVVAVAALALVPFAAPAVVSAQDIEGSLACGADFQLTREGGCVPNEQGVERIEGIVTTIVNIFSVIVAIVAVIMIIWGGFKYITSGGDSGNITTAKNTIIYAIIGLVIVALAQFLVQFVLSTVLGNN